MTWTRTPREAYPELFRAVQSGHVFNDSKTFVDAMPLAPVASINRAYVSESRKSNFDIGKFVRRHFDLPDEPDSSPTGSSGLSSEEHIEALWNILTRDADDASDNSSLIPLPKPYVVPGGRFREIYYWDSYFTMLGLATSGHVDRVQDMVDNFAHLIDEIGFVPNGNRSYYCTRSQPPYFALMVELLSELRDDDQVCVGYQSQLLGEHEFWMSGADELREAGSAHRRVVCTEHGVLNRYWDDDAAPRQESFAEDVELASRSERPAADLYRHLRAACESGWDFSSRWLEDERALQSIRTTDILPIDLNTLMLHLERRIARNFEMSGDASGARKYNDKANRREEILTTLFFDEQSGMFVDLLWPHMQPTRVLSLASAYPMFVGIATADQAGSMARHLCREFLLPGGWVTTLVNSGQQWDAPNGWAPLQWIAYVALRNYGFDDIAREGADRWVRNNRITFETTGQLLEKYDVETIGHAGGGGEYDVQDGFGWTNGVLLRLLRELVKHPG